MIVVLHSNDISSYADLSKIKWSQKLCLSQGKYIPNQSLVVNLINNLGDKRTQEVMQGWLANLSVPVLLDDSEVLKAIESGKCQIGLVNSNHYGRYLQAHPDTPIKIKWIISGLRRRQYQHHRRCHSPCRQAYRIGAGAD